MKNENEKHPIQEHHTLIATGTESFSGWKTDENLNKEPPAGIIIRSFYVLFSDILKIIQKNNLYPSCVYS